MTNSESWIIKAVRRYVESKTAFMIGASCAFAIPMMLAFGIRLSNSGLLSFWNAVRIAAVSVVGGVLIAFYGWHVRSRLQKRVKERRASRIGKV